MQYGVFVSQVLEGREQLSPILAVAGKRGGKKKEKTDERSETLCQRNLNERTNGFLVKKRLEFLRRGERVCLPSDCVDLSKK